MSARFVFHSHSAVETRQFGKKFSKVLLPGSLLALTGDLGAGKTTLIQGLSEGLGVKRSDVKSPTFVFFHIYKGRFPVYHFDLYRIEKDSDLASLGLEEYLFDAEAVKMVEWAERAAAHLPHECLEVRLEAAGENSRIIHLNAKGKTSAEILRRFLINR